MSFDVIVLGIGGVGSAALAHLARRGVRALGIERFEPGHDRGSSHGQTRLIRQAYYEHPDYVPLVRRSFGLWSQLEADADRMLYHETGLLQVGAANGEVLSGVRASAKQHGLPIEDLAADEVERRFVGFRVLDGHEGVFERRAGYLLVEDCVRAHAALAARLGAQINSGEQVRGWRADGQGVVVETDRDTYRADRLIVTAGPWAAQLLGDLGIPLEVRRKALFWFAPHGDAYRVDRGCPAFLYELDVGCFYGFPRIDHLGVKVAEHSGGRVVDDPLAVDRGLDAHEERRVRAFGGAFLPELSAERTEHVVCMYTMTPDAHFIVDRHPEFPQVAFAAGLSGHGFKFTPVLGEALAELAVDAATALPIGFLSARRPGLVRTSG